LIKKILVATDFSENANRAVAFAVDLADKLGASITILNVIENLVATAMGEFGAGEPLTLTTKYVDDLTKERQQTITALVDSAKNQNANLNITPLILEGHPVDEILNTTKNYDLLVIGHKGHTRIGEAFMGTTSERIVHLSKKPTLVIQ
jgi:nucleotide-binding universal stress UspA family protein